MKMIKIVFRSGKDNSLNQYKMSAFKIIMRAITKLKTVALTLISIATLLTLRMNSSPKSIYLIYLRTPHKKNR